MITHMKWPLWKLTWSIWQWENVAICWKQQAETIVKKENQSGSGEVWSN